MSICKSGVTLGLWSIQRGARHGWGAFRIPHPPGLSSSSCSADRRSPGPAGQGGPGGRATVRSSPGAKAQTRPSSGYRCGLSAPLPRHPTKPQDYRRVLSTSTPQLLHRHTASHHTPSSYPSWEAVPPGPIPTSNHPFLGHACAPASSSIGLHLSSAPPPDP